ncbi:family 43 glycosylhydrolase [Microbacterium sp. NPDC056569]|uniref:family 43 glycosylhydrolase n=1 Tax=Microbacterium sp. NPDC056569 TaxID=3345867 RepID=UPI003671B587
MTQLDPAAASAAITPGTPFIDDRGRVAQLHGVGIQRIDDRWWAWGEDKTAGSTFTAVAVYSSADLAAWRFEGNAIEAGTGDLARDRIIERPKALRRPDGRWVLYLHIDSGDYADARVGYAIADSAAGPYEYLGSERPLSNLSRDIGVYAEGDVAYLLSEDRTNGLHIYRLNAEWTGAESIVATLSQQARPEFGYESPALVKHDGLYYLFGSDLTGWSMNDNKYATAADLRGPWSGWQEFAPPGSRTFESQVSAVVALDGDRFLYIGDRWLPDDLANSAAVWLPLRLSAGSAVLEWTESWRPLESRFNPGDDATDGCD